MIRSNKQLRNAQPFGPEWIVDQELGAGSYGIVYRIYRVDAGERVASAMKWIPLPDDSKEVDRLYMEGASQTAVREYYEKLKMGINEEIRLLSKLRGNSHIVSLEDYRILPREGTNEVGYDIYIRMELLTPLEQWLSGRRLTCRQVIRMGEDLCDALIDCSRYQIIHRDIKPDNIFVTEDGRFKLGDFGIARRLLGTDENASQRVGSLNYMSPEVFSGRHYDQRADLYSLGLVMYKLFNDRREPFAPPPPQAVSPDQNQRALMQRMSGAPIPRPRALPQELDRVWDVLQKACAANPDSRYATPAEMKAALAVLEGLPLDIPVLPASTDDAAPLQGRSSASPSDADERTRYRTPSFTSDATQARQPAASVPDPVPSQDASPAPAAAPSIPSSSSPNGTAVQKSKKMKGWQYAIILALIGVIAVAAVFILLRKQDPSAPASTSEPPTVTEAPATAAPTVAPSAEPAEDVETEVVEAASADAVTETDEAAEVAFADTVAEDVTAAKPTATPKPSFKLSLDTQNGVLSWPVNGSGSNTYQVYVKESDHTRWTLYHEVTVDHISLSEFRDGISRDYKVTKNYGQERAEMLGVVLGTYSPTETPKPTATPKSNATPKPSFELSLDTQNSVLSWPINGSGSNTYQVYVKESDHTPWTLYHEVTVDHISLSKFRDGISRDYKVTKNYGQERAEMLGVVLGTYSPTAVPTTLPPSYSPLNLRLEGNSTLIWNAVSKSTYNNAKYQVYMKRSDASDWLFLRETAGTSFDISGLIENIVRDFKVTVNYSEESASYLYGITFTETLDLGLDYNEFAEIMFGITENEFEKKIEQLLDEYIKIYNMWAANDFNSPSYSDYSFRYLCDVPLLPCSPLGVDPSETRSWVYDYFGLPDDYSFFNINFVTWSTDTSYPGAVFKSLKNSSKNCASFCWEYSSENAEYILIQWDFFVEGQYSISVYRSSIDTAIHCIYEGDGWNSPLSHVSIVTPNQSTSATYVLR